MESQILKEGTKDLLGGQPVTNHENASHGYHGQAKSQATEHGPAPSPHSSDALSRVSLLLPEPPARPARQTSSGVLGPQNQDPGGLPTA